MIVESPGAPSAAPAPANPAAAERRRPNPPWWLLAAAAVWQIGAHVDAWYHAHWGFLIDSFFTWPHALLYGGWLAVAVTALYPLARAPSAPAPGRRLALGGAAMFGVGGALDYAWHSAFGFEASLSALVSPSHVWLIAAGLLTSLGVLEAVQAHRRTAAAAGRTSLGNDLAVALAVGLLFRMARYMLWYSEPLAVDYAAGGAGVRSLQSVGPMGWDMVAAQVAGTTGMILYSVLLALFLVLALRRLRLPAGCLAVVLLWDGALVAAVDGLWWYLPAVAGAALAGEALWARVRAGGLGGPAGAAGYWAISAVVPAVELALYFALMALRGPIIWPVHLAAGMPVVAGLYGLVAAMLAVPTRALARSD